MSEFCKANGFKVVIQKLTLLLYTCVVGINKE